MGDSNWWVQKVMVATIAVVLCSALALSGCKPPAANEQPKELQLAGSGKPIVTVAPTPRDAFKTIELDGAEKLVARGPVGKPGGTFLQDEIGDGPKTFNGFASYDATSSSLSSMMLVGLVETDAYTGEVYPYLAKSLEIKPDKLTYVVTLRKGLKWSDGKPITSHDVVFTWNDIIKAGLGNPSTRDTLSIEGHFPEVKALDDLTIEFKTYKPFAPFTRSLGNAIAPAHVLKPIIDKGGNDAFSAYWGTSDAAAHPEKFVSNGMWLLESYNASEQKVTFKRNPLFFMVDSQNHPLPYLDKFQISFVGDMNNQQLRFEQGKSDVYTVPGQFVTHVRTLTKPAFHMVNLGPTSGTSFLSFNLNPRKDATTGKPLVDPVRSAWFNNVNFRQAVDYAINRDDMVANILKGVGAPLYTSESLSSIYLNKDLAQGHPQDIDKAKALLKEGGFTLNDKNQLLDAKGNRVEFTLYTNSGNDIREATGVNIKEDLAQLGIQVNFKPLNFNVLVGKMNQGEWEAIIMGLTGSNLEPHSGANVWRSDGALHMFNQRVVTTDKPVDLSDILPWEKDIDSALNEGVSYFEFDKRKAVYDRMQQIIAKQLPFIYLYSPLGIVAVQDRLQNFDPTPLATLHNLEEIWIKAQ